MQGIKENYKDNNLTAHQSNFMIDMAAFIIKDLETDGKGEASIPLDHYYLNFGDVKLQNRLSMIENENFEFIETYRKFENLD